MKVLHVLDHSLPDASGYSLRSHAIIREQRARGWATFQVTSPKHGGGSQKVDTIDGVEYRRTSSTRPSWARSGSLEFAWNSVDLRRAVGEAIRHFGPDVIQAHSPCGNGLACLGLGVPLVYEMRTLWEDGSILAGRIEEGGLAYRFAVACESLLLRRVDAVVVISEGLRDNVIARGVPADRVTVVPNAVNPEQRAVATAADRDSAQRRFALNADCVLGYVGSLFAWEGLEQLLEALVALKKRGVDASALIVGGGPEEDALRNLAARLGIEGRVVFTGRVDHESALAAYDAIDVLAYPRLPMRLTHTVTPLKPLEAMAMGKAMVASDVGGHRELITDGETGVLFKAGNAQALAEAVLRVATDPALAAELQTNGLEHVRRRRTWNRVVARYEPVFRGLVEKRRP